MGKILLIPYISFEYFPRKDFKSLFKQFFQYGLFKPLVSLKIRHFTSIRQLIPLFFVLNFFIFFISFFINKPLFIFSSFLIILYLLLNFYFSLKLSIKEKNFKLLPFIMHQMLHLKIKKLELLVIMLVLIFLQIKIYLLVKVELLQVKTETKN